MPYYQDLIESYKRLIGVLEGLLLKQGPELTVYKKDEYPLLVLETSSDSVGFAIINGTPEPDFTRAYDTFKNLYREKHVSWRDRHLSFVICRTESKSSNDAFFGSMETDVYFCRKYVIHLPHSQDELERELLRLPFLPFPEGRAGMLVRPPSAQTLLQDLNVSAMLARQIVLPQECSATRIVDQLLAEKEAPPQIRHAAEAVMRHQAQPVERIRVKKVEIEAFRAYRKRQIFDVDADIVVLYGPNGLGKTSFFDALDYVCTGRIGRLCRHRISQKQFIDLARHLGSTAMDGFVSVCLSQGTTEYLVNRSVAEWGTALISGEEYDRASTLQFLTSAQWGPKKARIENLERLFRATHLFSQTEPELMVEFTRDSTLSPDLVSRMLALDDYASGLAKAEAVLDNLEKRITENDHQMGDLKVEATRVRSRLRELPQPEGTLEAGGHISKMAVELIVELRKVAGLKIDEAQLTVENAREWRAMVESTLQNTQDRLRQLQVTESGFAQYDKNRHTLRSTMDQISSLEKLIRDQTDEQGGQKEDFEKLKDSLEQERGVLARAKSRLRILKEHSGLQGLHKETLGSLLQWQEKLKSTGGQIETITIELRPLFVSAGNMRFQIDKLGETIRYHSQQIQYLSEIQDGLPSWQENRTFTFSLQEVIAKTQSDMRSANDGIDELKDRMSEREHELAACEDKYNEFSTNKAELSRLLDELETHVFNGVCPTCGADHESKAALIKRIHTQKQARPAYVDELAKSLGEIRDALKQDKTSLANANRKLLIKTNELQEKIKKLSDVRQSLTKFESNAAKAGLSISDDLAGTVTRKIAQDMQALELSRDTLKKLESDLDDTTKHMKLMEGKRAELGALVKQATAAIALLEKQSAELHSKADEFGLSLEMNPQDLAAETKEVASCEAMAINRIGELTSQMEELTKALRMIKSQINQSTEKISALRQCQTQIEKELGQFVEQAAAVLDRDSLTIEAIREQTKLTTEWVDQLHTLQRRCSSLELALDAAQRTAVLADLEAQANSLANKERDLIKVSSVISTIKSWFERVRGALDKQSSHAVANHVEALGPLTTLIQKRLRAVYGFGDVTLDAKGNEIRVVVGWGSEQVKPADYFSDSQKQILMLSIFLAGRLTQTWSGFAPILMDDPVTHFDDLNAFGFVELIRGLVSTSPGRRQFFISTCEQRLFDLMLKKFSKLEGGARFYRFESIGRDGPVVQNLGQ